MGYIHGGRAEMHVPGSPLEAWQKSSLVMQVAQGVDRNSRSVNCNHSPQAIIHHSKTPPSRSNTTHAADGT
jgi:hypothetical protein